MTQPWDAVLYPSREYGPTQWMEEDYAIARWFAEIERTEDRSNIALIHQIHDYQWGDIVNMPYLSLVLARDVHYAANATGAFPSPTNFDISEGRSDFEVRVPA